MREDKIKSKFLLYCFNKFDFPIRFLYTGIPIVRDVARKLLYSLLYTSGGTKVFTMYSRIKGTFDKCNIKASGKTVMEIGPGTSLVMAFCMLHDGAKDILLVDKFPRWDKNVVTDELKYLEDKNITNINRFLDESLRPKNEFIRYIENSCESLKDVRSGSVDIIISAGVLEHVIDMAGTIKEMNRVLRRGGVMYHFISLGDHYNFDKPFKFLKYSDFIWNNLLTKEGYSYTNRLRVDDYLTLCKENGFEILDIENIQGRGLDMKKINKRFINKSEEALKTVDCYMLARKAV